jgi:hypothetical protein
MTEEMAAAIEWQGLTADESGIRYSQFAERKCFTNRERFIYEGVT